MTPSSMPKIPPTNDLVEVRDPGEGLCELPAPWPVIPGGWTRQSWQIQGQPLELILPAKPDAFLDDPDVEKRHEHDGYMPYWAYLWPSAVHLAQRIDKAPWPVGSSVLELGCGVGLVGMAAARRGDFVTFSDYDPLAVQVCQWNAARLGLASIAGEVYDWRQPAVDGRHTALIGCEVIYETRNHAPLLDVLDHRLEAGGVAWFADGGRTRAEAFGTLLVQRGYEFQLLDEQLQPLSDYRYGRFQLLEIRRSSQARMS